MKRLNTWTSLYLISAVVLAIVTGCTRNISVTPTQPILLTNTPTRTPTHTSTFTLVPTFTNTFTGTSTFTAVPPTNTPIFTNTATHTFTHTPTGTATFTATRTFTFTLTFTGTAIPTNTFTFTNTFTSTPTRTFTPTMTNSPTNTQTFTPSFTPTNTPLVSNTPTPTPTPCYPGAVQASYTFESSIDCWQIGSGIPYVVTYGLTGAQAYGGSNSFGVSVNNSSGSSQDIQLNVTYASPMDLTGMMIIAQIYVDASLTPSDWSGGVMPFNQSGPNWGPPPPAWESAWFTVNNTPAQNVGAWFPVTLIIGSGGGDPSQVLQFGVQLNAIPPGAVGNFYIDNLQIVPAPVPTNTPTITSTFTPTPLITNTPTPTATPCYPGAVQASYTFESSIDCWQIGSGIPYVVTYGLTGAQAYGGSNSFGVSVNNSSGSSQDIQLNVTYASPMDLTGMMIIAQIYVDASLTPSDWSGGVMPFNQSGPNWGPPPPAWESAWFTVNNTPAQNVGAWFPVTLIIGSGGGDPSQVLQFGVQLNAIPPGAVGNFYIDNLQIVPVPAAPTNTPTITFTPTITNTPGVPLCAATPVNPSPYTEAEAVGNGGPSTGTNESCAAYEDLGTVPLDNDRVVTGNLAASGNDGSNYTFATNDQDFYRFTTGAPGIYTITLDCFSTGADTNDFDLIVFDNTCTLIAQSYNAGAAPEVITSPPLPSGTTLHVLAIGWDGAPISPYRLVIAGRAAATATPTDTFTITPTFTDTPAVTDTFTPTPTPTVCAAALQAAYTFDASTECWMAWNTPPGTTLSVDGSSPHSGAGALMVILPYTVAGEQAQIGLQFSPAVAIPAGSIMTIWYRSSTATGNAQPFVQGGGWQSGPWQSALSTTWASISFAVNPPNPNGITEFGFQVPGASGAMTAPATIWIDDVTIAAPPTPTPTVSSDCNPLFNGAETLTDNGSWTGGANATRSLSAAFVTQGASALDVNITVPTGWNENILLLNNFAPASWTNVTQLTADIYVEPALITSGGGWGQITLRADSNAAASYYQFISTNDVNLVAGWQTAVWNISYAAGGIPAGSALSAMRFIYNNNGSAVGHFYVDNIKLVYAPCPPTPLYSWNFTGGNNGWTDHVGDGTVDTGVVTTNIVPGFAGDAGALNTYVPFSGINQYEWVRLDAPPSLNMTGATTIEMYVWVDASIAGSGFPGGQIIVQSGAGWAWEQSAWQNLTVGGWTRVTFTPPFLAAGADITMIQRIAMQVHTGGVGTGQAAGNIKVDKISIY